MNSLRPIYFKFINWLIKNKKLRRQEDKQTLHRLISAVLLTGLLMWSYAFNAYFCIPSPLLTKIGFTAALMHLSSPLLIKLTGSLKFTTHYFIAIGFMFQFSHAFYTGGFLSNTIIWFSILPLIAAIILGKAALIFWSVIAILNVTLLYSLNDYTVNTISPLGEIWAQLNIAIGYILVNLTLMFLFIYFKDKTNKSLSHKNESIKKLLRVVSHDIANPLMIIIGKNQMLNLTIDKELDQENIEKIKKHSESINKSSYMIKEILDHTRGLDIIDTEEKALNLEAVSLNDVIENSIFVFKDKLDQKSIQVIYDFKKNVDIFIEAEAISLKNQVFNNLFSNSIKFMDHMGQIKIEVKLLKDYIEVTYSDTGVGMEQSTIRNLFRSDVKTTRTGVHGEEGTGFGMPILYSTLLDIGASVEVDSLLKSQSPQEHGTTFKLQFSK